MIRSIGFRIAIAEKEDEDYDSEEYKKRESLFNKIAEKEGVKAGYWYDIIIDDILAEKTKRMGVFNGINYKLVEDKIIENMPTGNEEIDRALSFYLRYKDELGLQPLSFGYRVKYKRSELRRYDLLKAYVNDHFEDEQPWEGFFSYKYCNNCNSADIEQIKDLEVRRRKYKKDFYDVEWSDPGSGDDSIFFVSERMRRVLEEFDIRGIEFRRLYYYKGKKDIEGMYQMRINNVYDYCDVIDYPLGEYYRCGKCGKFIITKAHLNEESQDIDGELVMNKDKYKGEDIFILCYRYQYKKESLPKVIWELIISGRLFNILLDEKITGFWVRPVHLR